jgi:uncharacterized protein
MAKLRRWPLYSLGAIFLVTAATFSIFAYRYVQKNPEAFTPAPVVAAVSETKVRVKDMTTDDPWVRIYPKTSAMMIKDVSVLASVANTWPDRIKGLSDTPFLPEQVVKLFVFDTPGRHSIWMKDMKYSIDILWVTEAGVINHIVTGATPESYPDTFFEPETPALYVIETAAGFVATHGIVVGDTVELPVF